jgi:hypothetical protein
MRIIPIIGQALQRSSTQTAHTALHGMLLLEGRLMAMAMTSTALALCVLTPRP